MFKKRNFNISCTTALALTILSLVASSCSNAPTKVSEQSAPRTSYTEEAEGRYIANEAAKKIRAYNFVEVEFQPQSAELSDQAKKKISETFQKAIWDGYIDNVSVLSWSDTEYPSNDLKMLSKDDRKLAEKRNLAIKNYLVSLKSVDVDTYNMAERPSKLSKLFNTTDNQLKSSLVAAGLPTTADALQYPSKASHSLVLIKLD